MNDDWPPPEPIATAASWPFTVQDGQPALRADFEKLQRDVIIESAECLTFLLKHPDHATSTQGTILIGHVPNPDDWTDLTDDDLMVPRYAYNVRQWAIPGTSICLTDLGADLVTTDVTSRFPHVVDPFSFDTTDELEQLLAGLRTLRT